MTSARRDHAHSVALRLGAWPLPGTVTVDGDSISLGNAGSRSRSVRDPATLPWKELGIDIALECTASSAPSQGIGASDRRRQARAGFRTVGRRRRDHRVRRQPRQAHQGYLVVSNGSCTTNCLAPVAKVLKRHRRHRNRLHDHDPRLYRRPAHPRHPAQRPLSRPRRGDVDDPTSTGAAKAIGLCCRNCRASSTRRDPRPDPNVSVIDLKIVASRKTDVKEINEAMKRASEQQLKGILGYTTAPNVSIDFNHDPHSSTFHQDQTKCRTAPWCG